MRSKILAAVFLLAAILLNPGIAAANLTILDPIITFAEGERNRAVRVLNGSSAPIQVKVSVVNLRRGADGSYVEAGPAQPGELFADKMLRFSPSQFTLAPGAQQAIRLAVQVPANAAAGQYQTYLRVEEVGVGQPLLSGGIAIGVGFIHQLPVTITRR